ncbi:hypothetical protein LIA77_08343 [Sarocladium implicatum]|nr:hypothetical protein LIA77_08343 [Sarocladium implicatum]
MHHSTGLMPTHSSQINYVFMFSSCGLSVTLWAFGLYILVKARRRSLVSDGRFSDIVSAAERPRLAEGHKTGTGKRHPVYLPTRSVNLQQSRPEAATVLHACLFPPCPYKSECQTDRDRHMAHSHESTTNYDSDWVTEGDPFLPYHIGARTQASERHHATNNIKATSSSMMSEDQSFVPAEPDWHDSEVDWFSPPGPGSPSGAWAFSTTEHSLWNAYTGASSSYAQRDVSYSENPWGISDQGADRRNDQFLPMILPERQEDQNSNTGRSPKEASSSSIRDGLQGSASTNLPTFASKGRKKRRGERTDLDVSNDSTEKSNEPDGRDLDIWDELLSLSPLGSFDVPTPAEHYDSSAHDQFMFGLPAGHDDQANSLHPVPDAQSIGTGQEGAIQAISNPLVEQNEPIDVFSYLDNRGLLGKSTHTANDTTALHPSSGDPLDDTADRRHREDRLIPIDTVKLHPNVVQPSGSGSGIKRRRIKQKDGGFSDGRTYAAQTLDESVNGDGDHDEAGPLMFRYTNRMQGKRKRWVE